MPSESFTNSEAEVAANGSFTFGDKMRVLRKLRELEFGMLDRGASPQEALRTVYVRALDYYDSVWPNDEGEFRNTLLRSYEKKLAKILREQSKRMTSSEFRTKDVFIYPNNVTEMHD